MIVKAVVWRIQFCSLWVGTRLNVEKDVIVCIPVIPGLLLQDAKEETGTSTSQYLTCQLAWPMWLWTAEQEKTRTDTWSSLLSHVPTFSHAYAYTNTQNIKTMEYSYTAIAYSHMINSWYRLKNTPWILAYLWNSGRDKSSLQQQMAHPCLLGQEFEQCGSLNENGFEVSKTCAEPSLSLCSWMRVNLSYYSAPRLSTRLPSHTPWW